MSAFITPDSFYLVQDLLRTGVLESQLPSKSQCISSTKLKLHPFNDKISTRRFGMVELRDTVHVRSITFPHPQARRHKSSKSPTDLSYTPNSPVPTSPGVMSRNKTHPPRLLYTRSSRFGVRVKTMHVLISVTYFSETIKTGQPPAAEFLCNFG